MNDINMPLWFDWLQDDEWWDQLDDQRQEDNALIRWYDRVVDEIIAEEDDGDFGADTPF